MINNLRIKKGFTYLYKGKVVTITSSTSRIDKSDGKRKNLIIFDDEAGNKETVSMYDFQKNAVLHEKPGAEAPKKTDATEKAPEQKPSTAAEKKPEKKPEQKQDSKPEQKPEQKAPVSPAKSPSVQKKDEDDSFLEKKLCYVTTAMSKYLGLPDDCDILNTMRLFRDTILCNTETGKELIDVYDQYGPAAAKSFSGMSEVNKKFISEFILDAYLLTSQGRYTSAMAMYYAAMIACVPTIIADYQIALLLSEWMKESIDENKPIELK